MADDVFGVVGTTQADHFRVERAVAKLVDGVMYRAQHGVFNAPVALKCFEFPENVSSQQRTAFTEKFRAEAELSFRLSSSIPELVRPLHVGGMTVGSGQFVPFIAYEWLDGSTLEDVIAERSAFGLEELIRLLAPAARALSSAHGFAASHGDEPVIHGDVRTQNIIVTMQDGLETVRLRDFGVLRARNSASVLGQLSDELAIIGSAASPEQWRPQRYGAVGPWTDVWGLALSMVEGLAGHAPIAGNSATMMGVALDNRKRPSPRAWGVAVSDQVEQVFLAALAVDPRQRTGSIREFWESLERATGMPSSFDDARLMGMPAGSAGSDFPPAGAGPVVPPLGAPPVPTGLGRSKPPAKPSAKPPKPPPPKPPPPKPPHSPLLSGELELDLPPPPQVMKSSIPPPPDAASGLELGVELGPSMPPGLVASVPSAAPGMLSGAPGASGVQINIPDSASPPSGVGPAGVPSAAPPSGPVSAAPASGPVSAAPASGPVSAAPASGPVSAAPGVPSAAPASGPLGAPLSGPISSMGPASLGPAGMPRPVGRSVGIGAMIKAVVLPDADEELKVRVRFPGGLLVGAIVLTIIDIVVARAADSPISAGPVTIKWLSIPLALAGVGLGIWQLLQSERDDD